ncbi:MAG: DnaJ domain-containing protein, partial [candidate division WOR-3 bacterium]
KAYRTLATAYHEDAGGSTDQMADLNEAYEVLSDPSRRQRYDEAYSGRRTVRQRGEDSLEHVESCLRRSGLKYFSAGSTFVLPFTTEHIGRTAAQVKCVKELAVIAAPLEQVRGDDRAALHNLLRATFQLDIYKLCCDKDGDFFIAAEVPVSIITPSNLEQLVRGCIYIADCRLDTYYSAAEMDDLVRKVQLLTALGTLLGLRNGDVLGHLPHALEEVCEELGVGCQKIMERKYRIELPTLPFPVHAACGGGAVSLIMFTGLAPKARHAEFYTKMARMNLGMDVCKVALDKDDEVAFLYELPDVNKEVLRKALDRFESYLVGGGLELVQMLENPARKSESSGRQRSKAKTRDVPPASPRVPIWSRWWFWALLALAAWILLRNC